MSQNHDVIPDILYIVIFRGSLSYDAVDAALTKGVTTTWQYSGNFARCRNGCDTLRKRRGRSPAHPTNLTLLGAALDGLAA